MEKQGQERAIVEKSRKGKEFTVGDTHIPSHYNLLAAASKAYNNGSPISIAGRTS
jgi:hypothetical protein